MGTKLLQLLDKRSNTEEQACSLWRADRRAAELARKKLSDTPSPTGCLTHDFSVGPAYNGMIRRADTYQLSVNGASWYLDTKNTDLYLEGLCADEE